MPLQRAFFHTERDQNAMRTRTRSRSGSDRVSIGFASGSHRVRPIALWLNFTILALTCAASAQSWSTVDDFQYLLGDDSEATAMTKDPSGALYTAGYASDASGNYHALVQKSTDSGATWTIVDDYPANSAGYFGITTDPTGILYAAGVAGGISEWFVRQSVDGGLTWSTVDDVALGEPSGITTDAAGNVYVAGCGNGQGIVRKGTVGSGGISWANVDIVSGWANAIMSTSSGLFVAGQLRTTKPNGFATYSWTVRRSTDGGATWTAVDNFSLGGTFAAANALGADVSGIYAVGYAGKTVKGKGYNDWVVRRSTNGGATWTTLDDFEYKGTTSNVGNVAYAFATDSAGNHYVAGVGAQIRWIVRKSAANTTTWSMVDDFNYVSGTTSLISEAYALLSDGSGNVFAAGSGQESSSSRHWIIRKQ